MSVYTVGYAQQNTPDNTATISNELAATSTQILDEKSPDTSEIGEDNAWIDHKRQSTQKTLNNTAGKIDRWFGKANDDKKATASLRVMTDFHYDKYDGESIKPKIRGRIHLPALENRLSIMIGADDLDNHETVGSYNNKADFGDTRFNKEQSRNDNSSLALRFSKWKDDVGIETDIDIGVRSGNELYLRLRAEKQKTFSMFGYHDINGRFEQIYRYGHKTHHYLRTNAEFSRHLSDTRSFINHSYIDYSHKDSEEIVLANNLYQHHTFNSKLGRKTLSYGMHISNRLDENKWANTYGPFINYRQPIFRKWFFVQAEANYYNDKLENKDHHLGAFLRLEAVF